MNIDPKEMHGGRLVGEVLAKHNVSFVFTLCGGHISPILIGAEEQGIRIVDVRHEATAVFAADAMARISGVPGIAAVTAGPGLTNTITAVKTAESAQSPVVLLGGATPTLLKGRGSLQDIDQKALLGPHVKKVFQVTRVRDIVPQLEKALQVAQEGVPGPVFVELPIDMLYQESLIRQWHLDSVGEPKSIAARLTKMYIERHVNRAFGDAWRNRAGTPKIIDVPQASTAQLQQVLDHLAGAERPLLLIGSQALLNPTKANALAAAVKKFNIPTYLSGMARGLLGVHELHLRHKRSQAVREADVIVLAGVPCDFRLKYGQIIRNTSTLITINRSKRELTMNCKPKLAINADPGDVLRALADHWSVPDHNWTDWHNTLQERNRARDEEIAATATAESEHINPVKLCQLLEATISDNSILVGDGGDFVATASYIVRPKGPLSWLDPGPFGTLGGGAGFALAAKLHRPDADVWILYGDGAAGYSIAEFDTFARHGVAVNAIIGNDAGWTQIARDQVQIFHTSLATELDYTPYHVVAKGYGGEGFHIQQEDDVIECVETALRMSRQGRPVLINAWLGKTNFREGSISM